MNTAAQRTTSRVLVLEPVAQGIDAIRHEAAQVRGLRDELGRGGLDEPGPQTERRRGRGFRFRAPVEEEWGRSESLDPDNVGDIADEGAGHRG